MAFVVARPGGRFEVRESHHTPKGPRARSLAGFTVLTDEVLAAAARRATRPFDADRVRASAWRLGAPTQQSAVTPAPPGDGARAQEEEPGRYQSFVRSSRRMARITETVGEWRGREPGDALIDLLELAEELARSQPGRPRTPLGFPALATLRRTRRPGRAARAAPAGA
ncbi:MAG: hypothetical protein ACYDA6_07585 [Solirubrobacteraceae bacterium]